MRTTGKQIREELTNLYGGKPYTTQDRLQARIEGYVLAHWYSENTDQKIASVMLKENLFYDEAKKPSPTSDNNFRGIIWQ